MSKGSNRRPEDQKKISENWDKAFSAEHSLSPACRDCGARGAHFCIGKSREQKLKELTEREE